MSGLERTGGFRTVWQVEIDDYCRRVLAKHWPDVRRWDDIRTFPPAGEWGVDVVCGGFPCQPVSHAGLRRGEDDERWLWPEFARIIRILRPKFAILENVTGLLDSGLGRVLGDLAEIGFNAEWSVLSSCTMGAPHPRQRVFVVAYPNQEHGRKRVGGWTERQGAILTRNNRASTWADPERKPMETEAGNNRMANGLSGRMVGAGGNAVVPQCAEWIGQRILEGERQLRNQ